MANVLLLVSDWNYQEKYYEMSEDILREFASKVNYKSLKDAWDWLMPQVDYGGNPEKPVKRCDDSADHTLDEYFLDWDRPIECVEEWEL